MHKTVCFIFVAKRHTLFSLLLRTGQFIFHYEILSEMVYFIYSPCYFEIFFVDGLLQK